MGKDPSFKPPLELAPESYWDPATEIAVHRSSVEDFKRHGYSTDYVEGQYDFTELFRKLSRSLTNDAHGIAVTNRGVDSVEENDLGLPPREHRLSINDGEDRGEPSQNGQRISGDGIKALDWTHFLKPDLDRHIGGGGFGDVYEVEWQNLPSLQKSPPRVVIKRFRVACIDQKLIDDALTMILREIAVCHLLKHDNVVPFLGVYQVPGKIPCLITEWMSNGSVKGYIMKHPETCLRVIILDVARGLHYLHTLSPEVIHGDLKADNVLINRRGQSCLCDFGLSRIVIENTLWNTSASRSSGTLSWMAPELIKGTQPRVNIESDVYAYGMTSYEIIKAEVPFHPKADPQVTIAIYEHKRPENDVDITEDIWKMITSCWADEPAERLKTSQILQVLDSHDCKVDPRMCIIRPVKQKQ